MIDAESRFSESAHRAAIVSAFLVSALFLLVVLGIFGARPAQATEIHKFSTSFNTVGVSAPTAVAYDEESDSLYVLDLFSGTVAKYTAAGAASNFSALGTNTFVAGCANQCSQLAVDNSGGPNQGVIYIGNEIASDSPSRKLYTYLPSGREAEGVRVQEGIQGESRFCGAATDSQEHLYIGHNQGVDQEEVSPDPETTAYIQRFKPGLWLPSEVSPEPQVWPATGTMYSMPYDSLSSGRSNTCRIAATSDGDQYFSYMKPGIEGVLELAPVVRAPKDYFDILPGPPRVTVDAGSTAFAVDQSNDDVYFVHGVEGDTTIVRRNDAGVKLETLGGLIFSGGVAIDGDSGTVFATDAFEGKVKIYTATVGPDVAYGDADVGATTADLAATIGTAGAGDVTDCKVEYGTSDSYGTTEQCSPDAEGTPYSADTPITAALTGLAKETTYHYRVTATNANGTTEGTDQTFTTHNVSSVSTDAPSDVTQTTATLNGSWVGDGSPTTFVFEWGEDDEYGNTTAVSTPDSTSGPVQVSTEITGLLADTAGDKGVYHYRIVATNGEGATAGTDRVFSTKAPEAPLVSDTETGEVTTTTASVAAMVNPNLGPTFYQFEYGPTLAYGEYTLASDPIGEDDTFHPVGEVLTGLQPSTTYHYRAIATNFGGTTFGPDQTFTTAAAPVPPAPPAPPVTSSAPSAATTPVTSGTPTATKRKKCKRGFVKRKGKCVKKKSKKKKKKRKHQKRRSNGHG